MKHINLYSTALVLILALILSACSSTATPTVAPTTEPTVQPTAQATAVPETEEPTTPADTSDPAARNNIYSAAPEMQIDPDKYYVATIVTEKGEI